MWVSKIIEIRKTCNYYYKVETSINCLPLAAICPFPFIYLFSIAFSHSTENYQIFYLSILVNFPKLYLGQYFRYLNLIFPLFPHLFGLFDFFFSLYILEYSLKSNIVKFSHFFQTHPKTVSKLPE